MRVIVKTAWERLLTVFMRVEAVVLLSTPWLSTSRAASHPSTGTWLSPFTKTPFLSSRTCKIVIVVVVAVMLTLVKSRAHTLCPARRWEARDWYVIAAGVTPDSDVVRHAQGSYR